jgi:Xaa-Pro dipeptidase
MDFDYAARQTKLISMKGIDAVALVSGANMVYFTGLRFHLSERPVIGIFSHRGTAFIIPELEMGKLEQRPDLQAQSFIWTDTAGFQAAFDQAVDALQLRTAPLGVDGQTMRVFEYLAFKQAGSTNIHNVGRELLNIRAIKTKEEVDAMREAIRISEEALRRLAAWVEPGKTELDIAAELTRLMKEAGSEGDAFEPLVQTGPNSALPHGNSTHRALQRDEFLLIDFGAKWQGYPADITRTFCSGAPTKEMRKIFDTVVVANRAAIAAVASGVPCGAVDKAARDIIEAAGYGEYFIHRTGHGLGLEIHELPQIAAGVEAPLETGMVFTVEPGIYVPGMGGVRIEDNVYVTEDGVEVLTKYPRELTLG